jgi:uncharacterized protein (DUF433 family)
MPIIEVTHVTKEYQLGQLQSLKTAAFNQWRRLTDQPTEKRTPFKTLNDVNFNIEAGEVISIIGHNGADKRKILKLQTETRIKCHKFIDSAEYIRRSSMNYRDRITIEPGKRGGKPCIRSMRITVYDVLDYLASGMRPDEILADFPFLTAEDIQACLAYAADRERHQIAIAA